jgi:hypothetical protein
MAIDDDKALPYGLRDVKLTPIDDAGDEGTPVDLPIAQTFSFSEEEEFEELRGDDALQATRGTGPTCSWDLEAGGISLEAYAVIAGGEVVTSGITPAVKKSYKKTGTTVRPYFKVEGQAINDNGGDFHGIVFKCRATESLEGELADGAFWVTSASGIGLPNGDGDLYEFVHNETAVAIPVV